MLDTNLKKSHKLKNWIIALIVLLPALVLVCLYPQMERAMLDKKEQWEVQWEEIMAAQQAAEVPVDNAGAETATEPLETAETDESDGTRWYLQDNFVNYAVEASYYQYAMLLQEESGEEVFTKVLEKHNWIRDYFAFVDETPFSISYQAKDGNEIGAANESAFGIADGVIDRIKKTGLENEELEELIDTKGLLGILNMEFDSYGRLVDISFRSLNANLVYDTDIYKRAKSSVEQYATNAQYYQYENEMSPSEVGREMEVCPKNFKATYLVLEGNEQFVYWTDESYEEQYAHQYSPYYNQVDYYLAIGAYWILAALVVLVAIAALILPFFKKLETGWEKLFSMPMELMLIVCGCAITLGVGMAALMSVTTMTELNHFIVEQGHSIELLGYSFSPEQCYWILLAVNFLGWALAFFMEYICVANIRQFFARPLYYLKHRLIGIIFLRLIGRQFKRLYRYITDIDINEKLHGSILKIVLANFVIVTFLCCFWFAGIFGVIVYSVLLYVLMRKYGNKLQRQYQSILGAAGQMAEGDLHITLEEDLGIFEPLGEELCGVQKGFAKAVAEEAKSQNMKSELITNVSHDLKTPLTAIITYVDLLKKPGITEEERQSYINTLDVKSQRLKVLIDDLFEVSKANSGNVKMNFMDVDIVKLMKEVRVEMSDKIEESNLDFRFNLPEEKVVLNLDGQRTYRIFENLLNNAIKYAMPFTRVYVDILNQGSEVIITFKNMSAQELHFDAERLTDRFVRGDSSRNSEGSGLGLAIAKSFTELQNGKFDVRVDGDLFKVTITFLKQTDQRKPSDSFGKFADKKHDKES